MLLGKSQHLVSSKKSRLTTLFTYFCLNTFLILLSMPQKRDLNKQHSKSTKTKTFIEKFWALNIVLATLLTITVTSTASSYAEPTSANIADQAAMFGQKSATKKTPKVTPKVTSDSLLPSTLNSRWNAIEASGKNYPVYFHAWGGDPQINSYIQWLSTRVKELHNIDLRHVKLTDTSEAVSRVLAEKSAENHQQGQVDLVWINGENFASMAQYQLLAKGWVAQLPNFTLTNPTENEAMTRDFGLPTQGMEAPWGQASLTFYYTPTDQINKLNFSHNTYQESIQDAPKNIHQLLAWAEQNPGRFTYPKPADFLSLSFLKYALIALNQFQTKQIKSGLYQAATPENQAVLLPVLWRYLDKLHPHLWRQGQYFVASGTALQRLVGDGEINLGFTFSAAQIPASVARYNLPEHTRSFVMQDGSLSNIHFVAIPYNAANSNSAKVVANFMLSVEAQAKKQQAQVWGDSTVIDVSQLPLQQQALFSTNKPHPSSLPVNSKIKALSEPHPSWSKLISREWLKRYGAK
ncbi:ABC transporter substrate-binding protein [Colwellia sp. PAMC 21821]|uniref:ABC transporter substrate-binding protein n=1 Tax=Colwellia sp. PAMC 21821 TaxID=1816219 RepID=UPI001E578EBF|nr:ABC transporter substrate-binding protein [Colwellia sp. PAMC 21821]